jgi:hypothetical protein
MQTSLESFFNEHGISSPAITAWAPLVRPSVADISQVLKDSGYGARVEDRVRAAQAISQLVLASSTPSLDTPLLNPRLLNPTSRLRLLSNR